MRIASHKALFALENVDIETAAGIPGCDWEPYQIELLNNTSRFGIDVKARQIGWSFTAALDAVIDGILEPETPHVFVSINLEEAKEKIRYVKAIIEATHPDFRPVVVKDSATGIELANGSRFVSHPSRPPRGKARARIYLDEMAHYRSGTDKEIYTGALPATTKGDGYIRIGSSPRGATGLFWEIVTESMREYPGYAGYRNQIPWWLTNALCNDRAAALATAQQMVTAERVGQFGTPALVEIFDNMFLEDFKQEYECEWMDEAVAWITWDVINRNQATFDGTWWKAESVDEALHILPEIQQAIQRGKIEPVLVGGLDIGRTKDRTEFIALGRAGTQLPVRFSVSLGAVEFEQQQACLWNIITRLPFTTVLIDRNGIGMQLAETLQRTGRAYGVDFTNETKELFAVEARIQAERGNTPLPADRDLSYQIHSIKRLASATLNRYDCERNAKHHADKFWAWALAIYAVAITRQALAETEEVIQLPWAYIR